VLCLLLMLLTVPAWAQSAGPEPYLSGIIHAAPFSTPSEVLSTPNRRVPLDVMLKVARHYTAGEPVIVTIILTSLYDPPLLLNGRMLVNHPLLQGELSFRIVGPTGQKVEIQRLITPLSIRDDDFVPMTRGQSIQREVDLADLFGMLQRGTYQLQVSYHNQMGHASEGLSAWRGAIWSEPTEIELE
jgi:hypothetical protein